MKYQKGKNNSHVHNCLIIRRPDEPNEQGIFYYGEDGCFARLNGYAIIPLEEYCKLKQQPYNDSEIKKADQDLWGNKVP